MTVDPLVSALGEAVGQSHVLVDPEVLASYEEDITGRWKGRCRLAVRPGDGAGVAAVLRRCAEQGAAVVPRGGNTGLVGGAVPRGGEVVLDLGRLDRLDAVDTVAAQMTVGAGVTLARAQAHARAAGLEVPVDLAARDSATIGGMVATNAGGTRVIRHGAMRANLVGVEAVLAGGEVVSRLEGLVKDNTGYDLASLLAGSEGTLGVVTAAVMRLVPLPEHRVTALLGIGGGTAAALSVVGRLRRLPGLEAAELVFADGVDLVRDHAGLADPLGLRCPSYLVVDCAGEEDPLDGLAACIASCPEVAASAVATDEGGRSRLWAYRERHTEAVSSLGVPHKLDVTLPLAGLAGFVPTVRARVEAVHPGARTVLFGHLADGNMHVNVVGPDPDDEAVDDAVLRLVAEMGGSISAEHGIGVAKRRWLTLTRSEADLEAMAALKDAWDPEGLLNPGVLLPDRPSARLHQADRTGSRPPRWRPSAR